MRQSQSGETLGLFFTLGVKFAFSLRAGRAVSDATAVCLGWEEEEEEEEPGGTYKNSPGGSRKTKPQQNQNRTRTSPEQLEAPEATMSHVDVKNLKLSKFEEEHYDEYDRYNLTDKYAGEDAALLLCASHGSKLTGSVLRRGFGPQRQNQERGQRQHEPPESCRTREEDRGKTAEQREEGQGVNPEVPAAVTGGNI